MNGEGGEQLINEVGGKQVLQHMCSLTSRRANSFLLYHRRRG